jgi:hypothetical protein
MRTPERLRQPRRFVVLVVVALGLGACGPEAVEANGHPNEVLSITVGQELDLTLQTIGPGEYASPPAVSTGAIQFLGVSLVSPAVPAGPTQQFRFTGVRRGTAVIVVHHTGQGATVEATVEVH